MSSYDKSLSDKMINRIDELVAENAALREKVANQHECLLAISQSDGVSGVGYMHKICTPEEAARWCIGAIPELPAPQEEVVSDELKACPFCGGDAELKYANVNVHTGEKVGKTIVCLSCQTQGPKFSDVTREDAWNIRAKSPAHILCERERDAWKRYSKALETMELAKGRANIFSPLFGMNPWAEELNEARSVISSLGGGK